MLSRIDSLDADDEPDYGLEMEPILLHHPFNDSASSRSSSRNGSRLAPIRTFSGSLLYARSGSVEPSSPLASVPRKSMMHRVCESRSRTVSVSPRWRGSIARTLGWNRRLSFLVTPLLLLLFYSITLNLWDYVFFSTDAIDTLYQNKASDDARVDRDSLAPPKASPTAPSPHALSAESLNDDDDALSPSPTVSLPPTEEPILLGPSAPNETEGGGERPSTAGAAEWLDWEEGLPTPKKPRPLPAGTGKAFVKQWCDMRGTTWYPTNATARKGGREAALWQLRAPLFLLPGAAYSGTVYLASVLHQHPQILPARTKELQFFHDRPFRPYVDPITEKTHVHAARQRMFARDYDVAQLRRNTSLVSFDATPGYLYYSSVLPRRILCVEPWVQLVVLLRHPVDRLLEHYAALRAKGSRRTLEEYIQEEMELLHQVGLLNTTAGFSGSAAEDLAWFDYQSASGSGLIGRSLYVLQLRHWIAALRTAGRDPATTLCLVATERWAAAPAREFDRVIRDCLHLAPVAIPALVPWTPTARAVANATRQQLEALFRPYNRQLKVLLRQYGISAGG
jgi:hypothetical protein